VIHVEKWLGLFVEPAIQQWFLGHPELMRWTNRAYSFIHIPGTILYLIILFYMTTTRPKRRLFEQSQPGSAALRHWRTLIGPFGPDVYEKRRRTMAMCNLLAFIVFTFWPCMPPRLLSAPDYTGEYAKEAKSYGFVDTVHSKDGDSSVWTTNRFCNQYGKLLHPPSDLRGLRLVCCPITRWPNPKRMGADVCLVPAAMPSLHFGYSFLIGLTVATVPLRKSGYMGWRRLAIVATGMLYPFIILTAIVATANHFVLDAVAGAIACILAWYLNSGLLNLLPIEDHFLNVLRLHKP
jgi:hypothetical protein